MNAITATDLTKRYGRSTAVASVSFQIAAGEIVGFVGPNGAGKTTTLRSIMGLTPPRRGQIIFDGQRISGLPAWRIARLGLGLVPEDRRIFRGLTVRENLQVSAYQRPGSTRTWTLERIFDEYPMLAELANQDGGTLSGGQQQMLAVARSLMSQPRLLLLDEPNEGLAPVIVQQIGALMDALAQTTTILFTDQSVHFALRHAQRAYILEKGRVVHHAESGELARDSQTQQRYLSV